MKMIYSELDRLEGIAGQSTPKDQYDKVLSSPLRAACVLSLGMTRRQAAKIPEVAQGSAPQWFIDEMIAFKEMCIRDHVGMDQSNALRLISALKKALSTLEFYGTYSPRQHPEGFYEIHVAPGEGGEVRFGTKARQAKEEIEALFKGEIK